MKTIAVEKGLTPIKDYLSRQGYRVSEMDTDQKNSQNFFNSVDAVVVSGMDLDFMGIQSTLTKIPVIKAAGLKPEEVLDELESSLM